MLGVRESYDLRLLSVRLWWSPKLGSTSDNNFSLELLLSLWRNKPNCPSRACFGLRSRFDTAA